MSDWWGSAPAWAAVVVGSTGALYARGAYERESRRDRLAQTLRLQEQANKVAGWHELTASEVKAVRSYEPLVVQTPHTWTVVVRNASDLPVQDLEVQLRRPLRDYDASQTALYADRTAWLAPGESRPFTFSDVDFIGELTLRIVFTDAQGVRWMRQGGRLLIDSAAVQPTWIHGYDDERGVFAGAFSGIGRNLAHARQGLAHIGRKARAAFPRRRRRLG